MNQFRLRVRTWLLGHLPDGLLAHPAEWFLAVLCALTGVTTLVGLTQPQAVEQVLPLPVYALWGASLIAGAAAYAVGLASIRFTATGAYVVTRASWYRLGLRLLGSASLIFAGCIGFATGWGLNLTPLLLFVAMCWLRLLALGSRP